MKDEKEETVNNADGEKEQAKTVNEKEAVNVDGIAVKLTGNKRLAVVLPVGIDGKRLHEWLEKNAKDMGYNVNNGYNPEAPTKSKRSSLTEEDFEPLMPHE